MAFYVYIIQSAKDESFYKGFTENPISRLIQHNNGESKYTSLKIPWRFVYLEEVSSKKCALIREKVLKKYSHSQIYQLIGSLKNEISKILDR
ncbi:GIY-YIG nuclease family protein [Pedobacter agri]|uniref:GIY-YIG nuclease family protein n=1 Tax=Pedobacter agri TaxID=454586 RepID=UPI0039776713